MQFLPRQIQPDEVEQEVTQRDQFNTDAVGLAETIVRESLQNSMDGHLDHQGWQVRATIQVLEPQNEDAELWKRLFLPLRPHLEACDVNMEGIVIESPRLLVIEDFGTTGLQGEVDRKDDRNFSDFWRRIGRSHKRGEQAGRWGLGKLVFSSASRIRTFFGLTVQADHHGRGPLLMGQAVLRNHRVSGRDFAPHAFFADRADNGFQVPASDPDFLRAFSAASGLKRTTEPGLSIVIPFVHEDISVAALLPHIIRNWFFPILTGRLRVAAGTYVIDRESFGTFAVEHGGVEFADGLRVSFIHALHNARATPPAITLDGNWTADTMERALPEDVVRLLRQQYASGDLIGVRVPLTIRPKRGAPVLTFVDLYLRQSPETHGGEALFVRGAITIPGEARRFRGRGCFGAMVAEDRTVASFLGDAEGPAHTMWSGTAEKVRENWRNPAERLKEVREALNSLYDLVAQTGDQIDPDALRDTFWVHRPSSSSATRRKNPVVRERTVPPIPRKPALYRLDARKGGFVVRGTGSMPSPLTLRVQTAYDVVDGNPLKQYSEHDFDLGRSDLRIVATGAVVRPTSPNELRIEVMAPDFEVSVGGFDQNRDIFVKADLI